MTNAVSLAQQASTGVSQGFKNRIINGAMVIDQRNAGASVTPTVTSYFIDRWSTQLNVSSKFSVQQLGTTPPSGFINYMRFTSLSAYSLAASDVAAIYQAIEGLNTADLGWGTANAKTVTLSFWVRSSLTGAFGGTIQNSGQARSYPYSYTINSANTWEYKTVTLTGDTTGTWLTTNDVGIYVKFSLGVGSTFTGAANTWTSTLLLQPTGSTNLISTNGATLDITGVQLEVGSSATSFETRSYTTELQLCQRYFEKSFSTSQAVANSIYDGSSYATVATDGAGSLVLGVSFCVSKRTSPTVTFYNPGNSTANSWRYARNGVSETDLSMLTTALGTRNMVVYGSTGAAWSIAYMYGQWTASAEL